MKTNLSNKPVIQAAALRALIIACLVLGAQWFIRPAFGQPWASYLVSTNAYWNVTDVTDPGQAVDIGELQAPFSKPDYGRASDTPLSNTPWHIDGSTVGNQLSQAFGTTMSGGDYGHGTVFAFSVSPNGQNLNPNQLLLSGNVLYGTTYGSGSSGTVFKVNLDGSDFITLHTFSGSDGANPLAGLILSGGVLYGTTSSGGANSEGTIFSINTDGTGFSDLHDFTGASNDGAYPYAGLVISGGVLYGTTSSGGANGGGIVFSINTGGTGFSDLHDFTGASNDGAYPYAGLVISGTVLYGTTLGGGLDGEGVVFSINTDGTGFSDLHDFTGASNDGAYPYYAGLVISGSVLYGTTYYGGAGGDGVVFSINTGGSGFQDLHDFTGASNDGANPQAGLMISGSVLYGTTSSGGASGEGVVFSVNTANGNAFQDLHDFTGASNDGAYPQAGVVISGSVLYGTTFYGGASGNGTLFSVSTTGGNFAVLASFPPPDTSTVSIIHSFSGTGGDGAQPYAQLAISGGSFYGITNVLYGTTYAGGASGYGTIFSINSDGSGYTILHSFTAPDANPETRLLISGNTLYGATKTRVFKVNTDGSGYTTLSSSLVGASELVLSLSGTTLDGTIPIGGTHGVGMVFSINTAGSGGVRDLHDFNVSDGENPGGGGLDLSPTTFNGQTVGVLYGTTGGGGANSKGTVFSVNTDGSNFQTLYAFGGTSGDGSAPKDGMVLSGTTLYGTTAGGGAKGDGTVFSISTGGSYSQLYSFSGPDGTGPYGKLTLLSPPSATPTLLGTTFGGGANGKGNIFTLYNGNLTDMHDFGANSDGASPEAGLALVVGDHSDSIWSLDTTLNISNSSLIPQIEFSIAIDNDVEVYVNGSFVYYDDAGGTADWLTPVSLSSYLHTGPNDIRVLIGGDNDDNDYFDMAIFNNTATYTPLAPTGVIAAPGDGEVTLTWNPVIGATAYNVYRSTTGQPGSYTRLGTNPTTTKTTYTDTGAPNGPLNGTAYYYEVTAVDVSVEGPPTQAGPVTPEPASSAPTGLTAMAGDAQVTLSWSAVSGATKYNIYRSTISGGSYTHIGSSIAPQTSYLDTGLTDGTTYYYVVTAVDGDVEGPDSSEVSATPEPPPQITSQPQSQMAVVGDTVTLGVTATGAQTYQWKLNGADIPGATDSTYSIPSVAESDGGDYAVVVGNTGGSTPSTTASLAVQAGFWPFYEGSGSVLDEDLTMDFGIIYNATWDSGQYGPDLDFVGILGSFYGSPTYVAIPATDALNPGTGPFTISIWFYGGPLANQGQGYPAILSNNPGSWQPGCFALRWQDCRYGDDFTVHWNPEGDAILDSGPLTEQTWHNAVVIRDGATISLYIDNQLMQTATVSATDPVNLGDGGYLLLGGNTWDADISYYLGSLQILRVFRGALTTDEINTLYSNPSMGIP